MANRHLSVPVKCREHAKPAVGVAGRSESAPAGVAGGFRRELAVVWERTPVHALPT